jgi:hypothetical protein
MRKFIFSTLIILATLSSCITSTETHQIPIPDNTPTPIPFKDIPIAKEIFSNVDLGLVLGETTKTYPDGWLTRNLNSKLGDNNLIQRFYDSNRNPAGFVSISLFEDEIKLNSAYETASLNAKEATNSTPTQGVGDKALKFDDQLYKGVIFIKCHALVIISVRNVSEDFINFYAKDFSEQIAIFSCR